MGYFMVGYLKVVGYDVIVYNCIVVKVEKWVVEYGGIMVVILVEVVCGVDMVLVCVGNDDDFWFVCIGEDGVFGVMGVGIIFVDYMMVLVKVIVEMYEFVKGKGIGFVDVLVLGG